MNKKSGIPFLCDRSIGLHAFSVELAKEIGVGESIVMNVLISVANDYETLKDTKSPIRKGLFYKELEEKLSYFSKNKLRGILKTLEHKSLIKVVRGHKFPNNNLLTYFYQRDANE